MSKVKEKKPIEIVVSTYWPTRIIKTIAINDPNSSYGDSITLSSGDAKYVYEQLKMVYEESKDE